MYLLRCTVSCHFFGMQPCKIKGSRDRQVTENHVSLRPIVSWIVNLAESQNCVPISLSEPVQFITPFWGLKVNNTKEPVDWDKLVTDDHLSQRVPLRMYLLVFWRSKSNVLNSQWARSKKRWSISRRLDCCLPTIVVLHFASSFFWIRSRKDIDLEWTCRW